MPSKLDYGINIACIFLQVFHPHKQIINQLINCPKDETTIVCVCVWGGGGAGGGLYLMGEVHNLAESSLKVYTNITYCFQVFLSFRLI